MRLFDSFTEWWLCVKSAAVHLAQGLWQTVRFTIMGLASLFRAIWRLLSKAVGKYPSFALGAFLFAVFFVWLLTFISMRARAVGAEIELGKVSYEFQEFKDSHGYE